MENFENKLTNQPPATPEKVMEEYENLQALEAKLLDRLKKAQEELKENRSLLAFKHKFLEDSLNDAGINDEDKQSVFEDMFVLDKDLKQSYTRLNELLEQVHGGISKARARLQQLADTQTN